MKRTVALAPLNYDQEFKAVVSRDKDQLIIDYFNDDNAVFLREVIDSDTQKVLIQGEVNAAGAYEGFFRRFYKNGVLYEEGTLNSAGKFVGFYRSNHDNGHAAIIGRRNENGDFIHEYESFYVDGTTHKKGRFMDDGVFVPAVMPGEAIVPPPRAQGDYSLQRARSARLLNALVQCA